MGAAAIEPAQHGALGDDCAGIDLPKHGALQQPRPLPGALVVIDMRVGAHGDEGVGVAGHELGDVAVQVERGDDGDVGAHRSPKAAEQFAFAILVRLGDHRAVQMQ